MVPSFRVVKMDQVVPILLPRVSPIYAAGSCPEVLGPADLTIPEAGQVGYYGFPGRNEKGLEVVS